MTGRPDIDTLLDDYDDWDCYQEAHHNELAAEWAITLLRQLATAIKENA